MPPISEIRLATPSEGGAINELHRRSSYVWEADRVHLDAHPDALGIAAEAIAGGRVRVALGRGGEILGFCVVNSTARDECELEDLFVEPDFFRQGIGRALVEDAAVRAERDGYREMTVVSDEHNFAFYGSVGFVPGDPVATRFGPATRLRRALTLGPRGAR
jgi:ribosomal protein S18 acetylase RimI-like enzyme